MHVDTSIAKGQRSRDIETVCEYRHLVTSPVTVGVLKNLDLIVALALTGATAFVQPQHPATGKALRAAAIEEEPEAPKYPTVNVIAPASDNAST